MAGSYNKNFNFSRFYLKKIKISGYISHDFLYSRLLQFINIDSEMHITYAKQTHYSKIAITQPVTDTILLRKS